MNVMKEQAYQFTRLKVLVLQNVGIGGLDIDHLAEFVCEATAL